MIWNENKVLMASMECHTHTLDTHIHSFVHSTETHISPLNVSPHLQPVLINYLNRLYSVLSITFNICRSLNTHTLKQRHNKIYFFYLLIHSINWYLCVFCKWLNGIWNTEAKKNSVLTSRVYGFNGTAKQWHEKKTNKHGK